MFELFILLSRYTFVLFAACFLYWSARWAVSFRNDEDASRRLFIKQRIVIFATHILAFFILSFDAETLLFDTRVLLIGLGGTALYAALIVSAVRLPIQGRHLLNCVLYLVTVSVIMLARLDRSLAEKQLISLFIGFVGMTAVPPLLNLFKRPEKLKYIYLAIGAALIVLPFFFGERRYGAVNWIMIGDMSFQPSELAKLMFVLYLASAFKKDISLAKLVIPAAAGALFVLALAAQRDLGGALIFFVVFTVMLFIATGRTLLSALVIASGIAACVFAYNIYPALFEHVAVRVAAWNNPWQDIAGSGYQVTQAMFAIGSWGVFGSGLTRGYPRLIPVVESDFIFPAICEEFGVLLGMAVIVVLIALLINGALVSLRAKTSFFALTAAGIACLFAFQSFLAIGGNIKLIPHTGVTLPFLSYGGSSAAVSMLMAGFLARGQCSSE